jgi:glycosyltransferase involved in cell wall biosynthesis
MATICINGKFTAQRTTGVQRVARQLVLALDRLLQEEPGPHRWRLLHPPQGDVPRLAQVQPQPVGSARLPLHAWEQGALPWAARGLGGIVNLAGAAPLLPRARLLTIHDAAVWEQAGAYTGAFVRWYRFLFKRQARRGAGLLTVSATSRERLARHLHVAAERFTVVANGVDHLDAVVPDDTVLDRHGLRGKRFLLAVGRAGAHKNIDRLCQAFSGLVDTHGAALADVVLAIVGGGPGAVFAAGDAPIRHARIVEIPPLTDAPLKALYLKAVALVHPSLYEGFGLPPLEAMRCGCPTLVAHATSLPEVCGDAALYFDPTDTAAIARALEQVLQEGALRQRLIAAGHAQAARYTWARAAAQLRQRAEAAA